MQMCCLKRFMQVLSIEPANLIFSARWKSGNSPAAVELVLKGKIQEKQSLLQKILVVVYFTGL